MYTSRALRTTVFILTTFVALPAAAGDNQDLAELRNTNPLTGLVDNTASSFTGWNAALHLTAFAITPALTEGGVDTDVHNYFARHQQLEPLSLPGVIMGYALPVAASGALLGYGLHQHSAREMAAASAVLQATAIALTYQSALKAVTGRPPPDPIVYEDDSASQTFRFGFMRGGIHYGWPSGHMMTTTAIVGSLLPLYPDSWELRIGGGVLLAYMLGSVALHESSSMHWGSDLVAGTLMGAAIGTSVGKGFARHIGVFSDTASDLFVAPWVTPRSAVGVTVSSTW